MTSPTNSQLRGLLRPDQTGKGVEVRAVTAFIPSETNAAPKNLSIFLPECGRRALGSARLCRARENPHPCGRAYSSTRRSLAPPRETYPLTNRPARPVDENA